MAYLPDLHYCQICGTYLGPDNGDGICSGCDEEQEMKQMRDDEKWRLWNAIDYFLDRCLDAEKVDDIFEIYEKMRREIWCPDGNHELIPDHCGIPAHYFCRYCSISREELDKSLPAE